MHVLAFDTSMRSISVAVARGGVVVARLERGCVQPAERLLPLIREVLADAGMKLGEIERLAVTLGPGGFTGIRVGLAMALGLRRASGCPIVALGSLQVMAHVAREQLAADEVAADEVAADRAGSAIAVAVPAGRGGLYVQAFTADARALSDVRLVDVGTRPVLPADAVLVGAGALDLSALVAGPRPTALADLQPDAKTLARLAPHLTPADGLRPMYIRPADAIPAAGPALI